MARPLAVAALALAGLLCAVGIGVAAYVVSRDSVSVPVTRLQPRPRGLAPRRTRVQPQRRRTVTTTPATPTTTTDDHGRRGGGGDDSGGGHGGGGHGSDD